MQLNDSALVIIKSTSHMLQTKCAFSLFDCIYCVEDLNNALVCVRLLNVINKVIYDAFLSKERKK